MEPDLMQLAGVTKRPKVHQAYQEWMIESSNTAAIMVVVSKQWEEELKKGKMGWPNAKLQMSVARELFQALAPEICDEWKAKAKEVVDHNRAEYHTMLMAPPSKDPIQ